MCSTNVCVCVCVCVQADPSLRKQAEHNVELYGLESTIRHLAANTDRDTDPDQTRKNERPATEAETEAETETGTGTTEQTEQTEQTEPKTEPDSLSSLSSLSEFAAWFKREYSIRTPASVVYMDGALLLRDTQTQNSRNSQNSQPTLSSVVVEMLKSSTGRCPMVIVSLPKPAQTGKLDGKQDDKQGYKQGDKQGDKEGDNPDDKQKGENDEGEKDADAAKTAGVLRQLLAIPTRLTIQNSTISAQHNFLALVGTAPFRSFFFFHFIFFLVIILGLSLQKKTGNNSNKRQTRLIK